MAGAASAANAAAPALPSPSAPSSSSPLADWAARVPPALARLRAACSRTAGDAEIEALTDVLERAFGAEEHVLRQVAAATSAPAAGDDAALERVLAPVAILAEEARKLANPAGGRGKAAPKRLSQAKAVSELVPALLWVAYSGPSCGEKNVFVSLLFRCRFRSLSLSSLLGLFFPLILSLSPSPLRPLSLPSTVT